jgi:hypothetical protein
MNDIPGMDVRHYLFKVDEQPGDVFGPLAVTVVYAPVVVELDVNDGVVVRTTPRWRMRILEHRMVGGVIQQRWLTPLDQLCPPV